MSSPRAYKTRAIVLRARNLGEADKIFTLLTDARGKLDAIAKGVRRAKSHVAGRLEFASEAFLTMHCGRNLDVIASADIVRSRFASVVDPGAFATAHLLVELVDAFCEHDLAVPEIYALLGGALGALPSTEDPASLVPRFELRLLAELGVAPSSASCVRCDAPLGATAAWVDYDAGGLTCENCRPRRADAFELSPEDVANFQGLGAERGGAVRPVLSAAAPVARAVDGFVNYQLGKRPKSKPLLDELSHRPSAASEVP